MTDNYTISELASEFQITTRTIRFYEERGLLTPLRIGGKRVFSAADKVKLKLILRGKRLGFSLEESADIIELYQPDTENQPQMELLMDKIQEKRELLEQQKKEINTMLQDLNNTEIICKEALSVAKAAAS